MNKIYCYLLYSVPNKCPCSDGWMDGGVYFLLVVLGTLGKNIQIFQILYHLEPKYVSNMDIQREKVNLTKQL